MATAAIDSMVLIYAGIMPSTSPTAQAPELREFHIRSRLLILALAEKKTLVILPTIAVSELLVPVPEQQRGMLIAQLEERFVLPPFDLRAASIAADLFARRREIPQNFQYAQRHVLKADAMIIASAKAAGAVDFYTFDDRCRSLADLVMSGKEPPVNSEEDMYLRQQIERGEA